ncbi:sulfatase-like hydrolase/transferase, partial [bacterium]|nr:sulfatase-like hydrolase/transferase [bacterium]
YYASISSIDRNIGYLLEELERLKLQENTIVIFMGDNGYMIGHHGLETKGNAWYIGTNIRRPNMFEYSILVPLIIRWPEVIEKGSICEEMVSSLDFFPTLVDILRWSGVEISIDLELDGTSIFLLLQGGKFKLREEIYLLYDMHHGLEAHMRMLRNEEKKLILHYEDETKHEFYNLKDDPEEEKNIFGIKDTNIQQEFILKVKAWQNKINDRLSL